MVNRKIAIKVTEAAGTAAAVISTKRMKTKKIAGMLLAGVMIMGTGTQVFAVTPRMDTSWVPKIPKITIDQSILTESLSEIELVQAPEITQAVYYHGSSFFNRARLQVRWNEVEGADSYEIKVTKKDGTSKTYTKTSTSLFAYKDHDDFIDGCVNGATVQIRSVTGDGSYSGWSDEETVGCNSVVH